VRSSGAHKKASKLAANAHFKVTRATKFKNAALREDLDSQVHSVYALNTVSEALVPAPLSEGVSELAEALGLL